MADIAQLLSAIQADSCTNRMLQFSLLLDNIVTANNYLLELHRRKPPQ